MTRIRPSTIRSAHRTLGAATEAWRDLEPGTSLCAYLLVEGPSHMLTAGEEQRADVIVSDLDYFMEISDRDRPHEHESDSKRRLIRYWWARGAERAGCEIYWQLASQYAENAPRDYDLYDLLDALTSYFHDAHGFEQSRMALETMLGLAEEMFGTDDPSVADVLNRLALLAQDTNDVTSAIAYGERALELAKRVLGPHHLNVAVSHHNLGSVYLAQRALEEARHHLEAALVIETTAGAHPLSLADTHQNLAVLAEQNEDDEAYWNHLHEAHRIRQENLAPNDPDLLLSMASIAHGRARTGRLQEAHTMYQATLETMRSALPPDDPTLGHTLYDFGRNAEELGDLQSAVEATRQSLRCELLLHTDGSDDALTRALTLARLCHAANHPQEQAEALAWALRYLQAHERPDHELSEDLYYKLGKTYVSLDRYDDALNAFESLRGIEMHARGGRDDSDTASTLRQMAQVLLSLGRHQEAVERLQLVYKIWTELHGEEDLDVQAVRAQLAALVGP